MLSACIEAKPAIPKGVTEDSAPPEITAFASPRSIVRTAVPMAWFEDVQAETVHAV